MGWMGSILAAIFCLIISSDFILALYEPSLSIVWQPLKLIFLSDASGTEFKPDLKALLGPQSGRTSGKANATFTEIDFDQVKKNLQQIDFERVSDSEHDDIGSDSNYDDEDDATNGEFAENDNQSASGSSQSSNSNTNSDDDDDDRDIPVFLESFMKSMPRLTAFSAQDGITWIQGVWRSTVHSGAGTGVNETSAQSSEATSLADRDSAVTTHRKNGVALPASAKAKGIQKLKSHEVVLRPGANLGALTREDLGRIKFTDNTKFVPENLSIVGQSGAIRYSFQKCGATNFRLLHWDESNSDCFEVNEKELALPLTLVKQSKFVTRGSKRKSAVIAPEADLQPELIELNFDTSEKDDKNKKTKCIATAKILNLSVN